MNLSDIRFVILALHLMRDPQRRTALLPLSMGSAMPPTSWLASSCDGEGMGMGLVKTENRTRVPDGCSVSPQVPRWHLPVVTGPRTMFRNH